MGAAQEALQRARRAVQGQGSIRPSDQTQSTESEIKKRCRCLVYSVTQGDMPIAQRAILTAGSLQASGWLNTATDEQIIGYISIARRFLDELETGTIGTVSSGIDANGLYRNDGEREIIFSETNAEISDAPINSDTRPESPLSVAGC